MKQKLSPFLPFLGLAFWLALTLVVQTWNAREVFFGGKVYFVDADCYSRMTRVKLVLEHPLQSIRHHDFENFPQGTDPHTTAPMDVAIAALSVAMRPFSPMALDLAGAWISPVLGLLLTGFLWGWSRQLRLPCRTALLALAITSPILAHGFSLGRPDHQSLEIFLLAVAIASELAMWGRPMRAWGIVSGVSWGLALWVSLFEPAIFLVLVLIVRFAALRGGAFAKEWSLSYLALGLVVVCAILFDGWRVRPMQPEVLEFFPRWSTTIGELNQTPFLAVFGWTGWLLPVIPFLLSWRAVKQSSREAILILALLLPVWGFTLWQERWGYFLALTTALAIPYALAAIPSKPAALTVFFISLWPVASSWDAMLFPDRETAARRIEQLEDAALLRQSSEWLAKQPKGGVVAPWWLSPPLAYWSGQACLAGSSHQSLPGTVETARFYLATDPRAAKAILEKRKALYVVAYEPGRVISTSQSLLGTTAMGETMSARLYERPEAAPPWLRLGQENRYFKVYRVVAGF